MTPTALPPPLYKFLSLAGAQDPDWRARLSMLLEGRCFHPGATTFNDPFDSLPYAPMPADKSAFENGQADFVRGLAEAVRKEIPLAFAEGHIREKLARRSLTELHDGIQQGFRKNAEAMGAFCLAECIDSILMWSHYASSHSGVALRFDFRRQRHGGLMPLWKVEYQEARPHVANLLSMDFGQGGLPRLLSTKASIWRYEQEWRSMQPDKAGEVVRFNPEVITGLIFGANCRPADEGWIRERCRGLGLSFERMKPHLSTYELVRHAAQEG